jgi:hypothetical protein
VRPGLQEDCGDELDNDCDGAIDGADRECEGAPSDACDVHTDCPSTEVCARHFGASGRKCSATCAADHHCGPLAICSYLPGAANLGFCQPARPEGKAFGEPCAENADCKTMQCFEGYCTAFCGGQWQCHAGYSCGAIGFLAEGWTTTVCVRNLEGSRAIGADCTFLADSRDCATQHCDDSELYSTGTCSAFCRNHEDCQTGQTCSVLLYGEKEAPDTAPAKADLAMKLRDAVLGCFTPVGSPGEGKLGDVCGGHAFCASYSCAKVEASASNNVCTKLCSVSEDCGEGFMCGRNGLNLTSEWLSSRNNSSQPPLPEVHTLVGVCVPE